MHIRPSLSLRRMLPRVALAAIGFAPFAGAQADSLPEPDYSQFNQPSSEQEILGKFLFWEEQIGSDNTMSCGTCHINEAGGSDPRVSTLNNPHPGPDNVIGTADDILGSPGTVHQDGFNNFLADNIHFPKPRVTGRRTPPAINAYLAQELFWDGRAPTAYTDPQTGLVEIPYFGALESQAAGPPTNSTEMARENWSWDDICDKLLNVKPGALMTNLPSEMAAFLAQYPTYPAMFTAAYGDSAISSKRIVFAIANYERLLVSDESPMDQVLDGTLPQLSAELQPGFEVFQVAANCAGCHTMPMTTDNDFHHIGVRPPEEDTGRFQVTADLADIGKFKTPHLRNVKLRAPFFHNGEAATLADVVEFYDQGGNFPGPQVHEDIVPLNLTVQQKADLVLFLEEALLDERVVNLEYPFTRPTLASELPSANTEFGVASLGGLGQTPELLTHVPANQGHPHWLLGVHGSTPNAPALAVYSFLPGNGTPFPDPRFPIPMNIDVGSIFLMLSGTTDGFGTATAKLPVPINSALAGMNFYGQWFIADAAATATGGVYGSKGVEVEIL